MYLGTRNTDFGSIKLGLLKRPAIENTSCFTDLCLGIKSLQTDTD
jgi:hypothetical protein